MSREELVNMVLENKLPENKKLQEDIALLRQYPQSQMKDIANAIIFNKNYKGCNLYRLFLKIVNNMSNNFYNYIKVPRQINLPQHLLYTVKKYDYYFEGNIKHTLQVSKNSPVVLFNDKILIGNGKVLEVRNFNLELEFTLINPNTINYIIALSETRIILILYNIPIIWNLLTRRSENSPGQIFYVSDILILPDECFVFTPFYPEIWDAKVGKITSLMSKSDYDSKINIQRYPQDSRIIISEDSLITKHSTINKFSVRIFKALPNNKLLLTLSDQTINIIDIENNLISRKSEIGVISHYTILLSGEILFASELGFFGIFNPETYEFKFNYDSHDTQINFLGTLPSGNVISASIDGIIKILS